MTIIQKKPILVTQDIKYRCLSQFQVPHIILQVSGLRHSLNGSQDRKCFSPQALIGAKQLIFLRVKTIREEFERFTNQ